MCFIINSMMKKTGANIVLRAEKDIICYKRFMLSSLDVKITGAYFPRYLYTVGKIHYPQQRTFLREGKKRRVVVEGGVIHSYSESGKAIFDCCSNEFVLKCIIPKNALYIESVFHKEYVSSSLLVTGECVVSGGGCIKQLKVFAKKNNIKF